VFDFNLLRPFLLAFGMNVASGFGAPFPEELTMVGAGVWTASAADSHGGYRFLMLPVALVGVVLGDLVLYTIGLRYGTKLLEYRWAARFFPEVKRQRIERNFHRYGVTVLLFGRLLPTIRAPLFLTAGMMRLPLGRFLLADGIGAVIGNSLLFFLGYFFGDAILDLIKPIEEEFKVLRPILVLVALVGVTLYLLYHFYRSPVTTGDPKEIPIIGSTVAARIDSESRKVPLTNNDHVGPVPQPKADLTAESAESAEKVKRI
jgi:membrane protein DedA with SNARE-associated domain